MLPAILLRKDHGKPVSRHLAGKRRLFTQPCDPARTDRVRQFDQLFRRLTRQVMFDHEPLQGGTFGTGCFSVNRVFAERFLLFPDRNRECPFHQHRQPKRPASQRQVPSALFILVPPQDRFFRADDRRIAGSPPVRLTDGPKTFQGY